MVTADQVGMGKGRVSSNIFDSYFHENVCLNRNVPVVFAKKISKTKVSSKALLKPDFLIFFAENIPEMEKFV